MTPATRWAAGIAVVAGAAIAGFAAYRAIDPGAPASAPSGSATTGTSSGDPAGGGSAATPPAKRVIPEVLPSFQLQDRDGQLKSLQDFGARPLLVNFWATWCAPCRREIPLLSGLRKSHAPMGLEVVGIAVDFREDVLKYADEIGLDYPLLIGEQDGLDAVAAFGIDPMFPVSIFSDRGGRIVAVRIGELHADEADFILARVADVDAGTLELPAAKQQIAAKLHELALDRAKENPDLQVTRR